jgi:hypothetical protein
MRWGGHADAERLETRAVIENRLALGRPRLRRWPTCGARAYAPPLTADHQLRWRLARDGESAGNDAPGRFCQAAIRWRQCAIQIDDHVSDRDPGGLRSLLTVQLWRAPPVYSRERLRLDRYRRTTRRVMGRQ